jgi:ribulose 1,5-bisphosphate synthetase/thiazole synthase
MSHARGSRTDVTQVGSRALNRRRLLATSAAAGVATAVGTAPARAAEASVDVAIVGAGISGMVAARVLLKSGRTVVILEANKSWLSQGVW